MFKTIKKFFIVVMVLFTCLHQQTFSVKAANTFEINGVSVQYYDFYSSPDQCWRYANNIYTKIWGTGIYGTTSELNLLEGLSADELLLTEEHLKTYIGYAALGSAIRLTNYYGLYSDYDMVGHSQILVQKDENGFTILEGGMSAAPHCREHYYTWSEYLRVWSGDNYRYIKYIIWPQAMNINDIDKAKETEILVQQEEFVALEQKNVNIERARNVSNVSYPSSTAYAASIHGHIHKDIKRIGD